MGEIDAADRAALSFYTGYGAEAVNSLLRGRTVESADLRRYIVALDIAVGKGRLISNYPAEQEVILPRNTRMRVSGYDAGLRTLVLEIIA